MRAAPSSAPLTFSFTRVPAGIWKTPTSATGAAPIVHGSRASMRAYALPISA